MISIVFDDNYTSHYQIAAPILEANGLRGTFAIITSRIDDWAPWKELHEKGHEIASHTHTHPYANLVTPQVFEDELALASFEIEEHIAKPASFVYPGGVAPQTARESVARFHKYARAGSREDRPSFPYAVPGTGYYEPFDLARMLDDMKRLSGNWYIPYFHGLGEISSRLIFPTKMFRAFIEAVAKSGIETKTFGQSASARASSPAYS